MAQSSDPSGSPRQIEATAAGLAADAFTALLETAAHGFWMLDFDTAEVFWSPRLREMLPAMAEGVTLADISELTHPEDRSRHEERIAEARRADGGYDIDVRFRVREGGYRWLSARGVWLPGPAGPGQYLLGFIHDVNDTYEARQALERSEQRFRAFFDKAPVAAYIKDGEGRHLYANAAAAAVANKRVDEVLGRTMAEILPEEVAARLRAVDQRVLAGHTVETWTGDVEFLDGRRRSLFDVKFPIPDLDSDRTLVGGFGIDITEQVRAQERLQSTQRLEMLGLLAGGIAHDFNNLLAGIMGNAELAAQQFGESRHLSAIVDTAAHAAELCDQLLAAAGRRPPDRQVVDPVQLIRGAEDLLRISARRSQADIRFELAASTAAILTDPSQLRQVLLNLVVNAVEAIADAAGTITVRCANAAPPDLSKGLWHSYLDDPGAALVEVSVTDDGPGMSGEVLERIFDPFYSTKSSGDGLGLAAVLGIVRSNRGALGVISRPGQGTVLRVLFPATDRLVPAQGDDRSPSAAPLTGRALVVDDDPTVGQVAQEMLRQFGLEASCCENGQRALAMLADAALTFDLVVLDLSMPEMSGLECLRRIRDRYPQLPVLLCSGYSEQPAEPAATDDPATGFLRKPFGVQEFRHAVVQMLGAARG